MNKEVLFLQYFDDNLTTEEKRKVELMVSENKANKQLFEEVKEKRENALDELNFLNPKETIEIPPFVNSTSNGTTKKVYKIRLWHYAAIAAILIGVYFGLYQLLIPKDKKIEIVSSEEIQVSKTKYKELDCYISPNRCWNQKQLVWQFIEITH